jgi:hypothetical protein
MYEYHDARTITKTKVLLNVQTREKGGPKRVLSGKRDIFVCFFYFQKPSQARQDLIDFKAVKKLVDF